MNLQQWKLLIRFMFEVIYLLNRRVPKTDTDSSNWKLEYDLEKEVRKLDSE